MRNPEQELRGSNKSVRQRILDQIRRGTEIQLLHKLGFVEFNGSRRNLKTNRDVFHRSPFRQELQHLTLSKGERFFAAFDPIPR